MCGWQVLAVVAGRQKVAFGSAEGTPQSRFE